MGNPKRTQHVKKRQLRIRRWLAVAAVFLIVSIVVAAYVWYPKSSGQNQQVESTAFREFTAHYISLMKSLNSSQTKAQMLTQLNPSYNQTDLFTWEKSKLTFAQDQTGFYEDPNQILGRGQGICVQWSAVYVSACLALGYQSRLVIAADTSTWSFIHVWAEDYYKGTWVHVDPSDGVWNNPSRYQTWGWGDFGGQVKIYAFDDRGYQEVTSTYAD